MAGTIGGTRRGCGLGRPGLNGVRPRWPEQFCRVAREVGEWQDVSMESGLDGRNNWPLLPLYNATNICLNGVRPRWPEQFSATTGPVMSSPGLNGVRPRWPEQSL